MRIAHAFLVGGLANRKLICTRVELCLGCCKLPFLGGDVIFECPTLLVELGLSVCTLNGIGYEIDLRLSRCKASFGFGARFIELLHTGLVLSHASIELCLLVLKQAFAFFELRLAIGKLALGVIELDTTTRERGGHIVELRLGIIEACGGIIEAGHG